MPDNAPYYPRICSYCSREIPKGERAQTWREKGVEGSAGDERVIHATWQGCSTAEAREDVMFARSLTGSLRSFGSTLDVPQLEG